MKSLNSALNFLKSEDCVNKRFFKISGTRTFKDKPLIRLIDSETGEEFLTSASSLMKLNDYQDSFCFIRYIGLEKSKTGRRFHNFDIGIYEDEMEMKVDIKESKAAGNSNKKGKENGK